MEGKHWHTGADHILIYGLSAILVINVVYYVAAKMATSRNKFVQNAGLVAGSLVRK